MTCSHPIFKICQALPILKNNEHACLRLDLMAYTALRRTEGGVKMIFLDYFKRVWLSVAGVPEKIIIMLQLFITILKIFRKMLLFKAILVYENAKNICKQIK